MHTCRTDFDRQTGTRVRVFVRASSHTFVRTYIHRVQVAASVGQSELDDEALEAQAKHKERMLGSVKFPRTEIRACTIAYTFVRHSREVRGFTSR